MLNYITSGAATLFEIRIPEFTAEHYLAMSPPGRQVAQWRSGALSGRMLIGRPRLLSS